MEALDASHLHSSFDQSEAFAVLLAVLTDRAKTINAILLMSLPTAALIGVMFALQSWCGAVVTGSCAALSYRWLRMRSVRRRSLGQDVPAEAPCVRHAR